MIYKEKILIFCILYVFTREIKSRKNRIMNLKNKEVKAINKIKIYIKNLHLYTISGDFFI